MADELSPLAKALRDAWIAAMPKDTATGWEAVAAAARKHLGAAPPAAPTERPTCATCPYFHVYGADGYGECRKLTPMLQTDGYNSLEPTRWCGDHPDFPAWIAARAEGGR